MTQGMVHCIVHLFEDLLCSAVLTIVDIIRRIKIRTEAALTVRRLELNIEASYDTLCSHHTNPCSDSISSLSSMLSSVM